MPSPVKKKKPAAPKPKAKAKPKPAPKPKAPPKPEPVVFIMPASLKGLRFDKALVQVLEARKTTRSKVSRFLEEGRILVAGVVPNARMRVKGGEAVSVDFPLERSSELVATKMALDILYEDKDLIVVNKPAGLVTHPGAGHFDDTLANALLAHCKGTLKAVGMRPGIVHRLDKDTTGCIVAAKNEEAFSALQSLIGSRQVTRLYLAMVWGDLREDSGTVDAAMGRGPDRKKMALRANGGKSAVTHFKVLNRYKHACELECKLETGRTHQIRVHLAGIGHGVVGDQGYGRQPGHLPPALAAALPKTLDRQALHAWKLQFKHPLTGKAINAEAPPPADYLAARKLLRAAE